jgi:membrane protein required for colicin V production
MHAIDIVFLVVAAILVAVGVKRGFIGEIFRLLAMVVGFVVAALFYRQVSTQLPFSISVNMKIALAFARLYIVTALVLLVVGWFVRKVVHLTMLGWVDRLCGGGIGFLKALLLAWLVALIVSVLPFERLRTSVESALVYRVFAKLPPKLYAAALEDAQKTIKKAIASETIEKIETFRDKVDSAYTETKRGP